MRDIKDSDGAGGRVDAVPDTPVSTATGGVLSGVLGVERMPDPVGILQERPDDEFGDSGGHLLR